MPELSRRKFLTQASIGVAAGVAGGVVAGGIAALPELASSATKTPLLRSSLPAEPLVAHVRDASTGEISVMVGTREVVYVDHDLTGRLIDASRRRGGQ